MFEAVLQGETPDCWIRDVSSKYPTASVNIVDLKPLDEGKGIQELFEIAAAPQDTDSIIQLIRDSKRITDVEFMRTSKGIIYGSGKVYGRRVCMAFLESNCFLVSERNIDDLITEWKIRGAGDAFQDLMKRLDDEGLDTKLKRMSNFTDEKPLTPRQAAILETAMERGFFDYPRKINLHQLAKESGVRPATLSEILRRAQKKALKEYLGNVGKSMRGDAAVIPLTRIRN